MKSILSKDEKKLLETFRSSKQTQAAFAEVNGYVYECPNCVDENDGFVTKSAKEKRMIEKSPVTPSLLAHIFVSKHMMYTPYYCLEDAYNWQGIVSVNSSLVNKFF